MTEHKFKIGQLVYFSLGHRITLGLVPTRLSGDYLSPKASFTT